MVALHPTLPLNGVVSNARSRTDSGRSQASDRTAGVDPSRPIQPSRLPPRRRHFPTLAELTGVPAPKALRVLVQSTAGEQESAPNHGSERTTD